MAITFKRLGAGRPTDTDNLSIYTVAASTTAHIHSIIICNTTTSDATARVFLTPTGGSADQTTAILYDYIIPANQSFTLAVHQVLVAAGQIYVRSGTGSALTFTVSGQEIV